MTRKGIALYLAMTKKGIALYLAMTRKNNLNIPLHFTTLINSYIEKRFRKRGVTIFGGLFFVSFFGQAKKEKVQTMGYIKCWNMCNRYLLSRKRRLLRSSQ